MHTFSHGTKILFLAFTLASFAACGNGKRITPDNTLTVNGSSFAVLSGSCPANAVGFPEGTCSLVSPVNLGGVDSGKSFAVSFQLEDGGSITFHVFSEQLQDGVDIIFKRSGSILTMTGVISGQVSDYSQKFANYDATKTLSFQFDVHNDEEPTHMLLWDAVSGPAFAEEDKLINSECGIDPNDPAFDCHHWQTARGQGSAFGISLDRAVLIKADIEAPKFEE